MKSTNRQDLFDLLDQLSAWILSFGLRQRVIRWAALSLFVSMVWVILAMLPDERAPGAIRPEDAFTQGAYVVCQVRAAVIGPAVVGGASYCDQFADPQSVNFSPLIFEIPFRRLFGAGVLQHVLVLAFAGWLAFQAAAHFQAEVYNLPDTSCAAHYLLQGAFINPYNTLNIHENEVAPGEKNLPLHLIGGPGDVCVHLENAALFEQMDGTPRVIGPTVNQCIRLEGFERLRKAIDLRDQNEVFVVSGRSQDGIRVTAKDVHVVYSVYRDHQEPSYERPYPFQDPQAIENLVYERGGKEWHRELSDQLRGSLLDFFAMHPLSEFLAMVQEPELKKNQAYEQELLIESQSLAGAEGRVDPPPLRKIEGIEYVPRPQLTDLFYTHAKETWPEAGMQIDWIGVGTWDFPAQVIRTRHQEAWRISHENLARNNPAAYQRLRSQQKIGEVQRLIQSIAIATFQKVNSVSGITLDDVMRTLILAYHTQMREAIGEYERAIRELDIQLKQKFDPVEIVEFQNKKSKLETEYARVMEVVFFLTRFTANWLRKPPPGKIVPGAGSPGAPSSATPGSSPTGG